MTALDVARSYLGTHDGTPFRHFLGLPAGAPWCLAFALFCHHTASPGNRLPRTGRCYTFLEAAEDNPLRYQVVSPEDAAWGVEVRAGDVAIFSHDPSARNWNGHAALVVAVVSRTQVRTLEGNTSSNDKGDQRNGNTVAEKVRRLGVHGFELEGFVRERAR